MYLTNMVLSVGIGHRRDLLYAYTATGYTRPAYILHKGIYCKLFAKRVDAVMSF